MLRNFIIFSIIFSTKSIFAQTDSIFVVNQNGTSFVKMIVDKQISLREISNRYNVSAELLQLFNSYSNSEIIQPNGIVKLPLTETNYYKNTSIANNQGFVPLYYIVDENEKVVDVSRKFLIAEGTLYKWNNFKSQTLDFGKALQIGWLKDNNSNFKPIVTGVTMESEKNLGYNANNTFKQDIKNDFENAKSKISTSFKTLGKNIRKIGPSKNVTPNYNAVNGLNNNDSIEKNNLQVNGYINVVNDTIAQLPTSSKNRTDNFKKGFNKTTEVIGNSFTKLGATINKNIEKIGGATNKSYQKEQQEKEARIKLENEKRLEINKQVVEVKPIETKLNIADAEIENKDTKTTTKDNIVNDVAEIPTYTKENADAMLYENTTVEKPIKKAIENEVLNSQNKINPKSGKAITFYAGANGMHLAYTDYAPKDSKILVENKKNGKKIIATVLGPLQKNGDDENGIFILLSDTVKKDLSPNGENFVVEVSKYLN